MSPNAKVETSEPIARQRVSTALQNDGTWSESFHHLGDDGTEDGAEGFVVHAIVEGEVDGIILPLGVANIEDVAGAGEILTELVEADGHDAVGGVEGLLDAVAVVDVNVDVEDALVLLEELEDGKDAVVDVAEAGGLGLLGVMETAGPVDDDVGAVLVETAGAADGTGRVKLAELEEAVEHRAVLPHVEALQLADVVLHVVGGDDAEEVDVIVGMEARHCRGRYQPGTEDLHPAVQAVVDHQVVRHSDTMGLHGMALAVVVVANLGIVEVRNASGIFRRHSWDDLLNVKLARRMQTRIISAGCRCRKKVEISDLFDRMVPKPDYNAHDMCTGRLGCVRPKERVSRPSALDDSDSFLSYYVATQTSGNTPTCKLKRRVGSDISGQLQRRRGRRG